MQSVEEGLDLTDRFLQAFLQVDSRLDDPSYTEYLRKLRYQHKRAMSVTENWAKVTASDVANLSAISNAQCYCKDPVQYVAKPEGSGDRGSWHEERTVQYTEEWVPTEEAAEFSTVACYGQLNPTEYLTKSPSSSVNSHEKNYDCDDRDLTNRKLKANEVPQSSLRLQCDNHYINRKNMTEIQRRTTAENERNSKTNYSQKPISKYEYRNTHLRRCLSAEASEWSKSKNFKANAVPLAVYVKPLETKLNAEIRARSRSERAINLINNSHLPFSMQEHMIRSRMQHNLRHSKTCTNLSPTYQPKMPKKVPNFSAIHKRLLEAMENGKVRRCTTVEPFHFDTESRAQLRHHCTEESPSKPIFRSKTPIPTGQAKCVRLNTAALMRNQAIREDMKKAEEAKETEKRLCDPASVSSQLSRIRLKNKLQSNIILNPTEEIRRKVQQKKKEQLERDAQYRNELEQISRRLTNRALIIEQQEMLMEKQKFEKKYAEKINSILDRSKKLLFNNTKTIGKAVEKTASRNEKYNDLRIPIKSLSNSENMSDEEDFELYSGSVTSSNDKLSKISERTEE